MPEDVAEGDWPNLSERPAGTGNILITPGDVPSTMDPPSTTRPPHPITNEPWLSMVAPVSWVKIVPFVQSFTVPPWTVTDPPSPTSTDPKFCNDAATSAVAVVKADSRVYPGGAVMMPVLTSVPNSNVKSPAGQLASGSNGEGPLVGECAGRQWRRIALLGECVVNRRQRQRPGIAGSRQSDRNQGHVDLPSAGNDTEGTRDGVVECGCCREAEIRGGARVETERTPDPVGNVRRKVRTISCWPWMVTVPVQVTTPPCVRAAGLCTCEVALGVPAEALGSVGRPMASTVTDNTVTAKVRPITTDRCRIRSRFAGPAANRERSSPLGRLNLDPPREGRNRSQQVSHRLLRRAPSPGLIPPTSPCSSPLRKW